MSEIVKSMKRADAYRLIDFGVVWAESGSWHAVLTIDLFEGGQKALSAIGATPEEATELAVQGWEVWREDQLKTEVQEIRAPPSGWYFANLSLIDQKREQQFVEAAQNDA